MNILDIIAHTGTYDNLRKPDETENKSEMP